MKTFWPKQLITLFFAISIFFYPEYEPSLTDGHYSVGLASAAAEDYVYYPSSRSVTIDPEKGSAADVNFRKIITPTPVFCTSTEAVIPDLEASDYETYFQTRAGDGFHWVTMSTGTVDRWFYKTTGEEGDQDNPGDFMWKVIIGQDQYEYYYVNGICAKHPIIIYYTPGKYTVTHWVTNELIESDPALTPLSIQKTIDVLPALVPKISVGKTVVEAGSNVTFDASGSEGTIQWSRTKWESIGEGPAWTLKGTEDNKKKATFRIPSAGSYTDWGFQKNTIRLTLRDEVGPESADIEMTVNRPPTIDRARAYKLDTDTIALVIDIGGSVTLGMDAHDRDNPETDPAANLSYSWDIDWGAGGEPDGVNYSFGDRFAKSTTFTLNSYPENETPELTIVAKAVDQHNALGYRKLKLSVNRPPKDISVTPAGDTVIEDGQPVVNEGAAITINAEATDPDGDDLSYIWYFDNGTPDSVKDANDTTITSSAFEFRVPSPVREGIQVEGGVNIKLNAKATDGSLESGVNSITIKINRPPNVAVGGTHDGAEIEGQEVTLKGQAVAVPDPDGDTVYYKWVFDKRKNKDDWDSDIWSAPAVGMAPPNGTKPEGRFTAPLGLKEGVESSNLVFRLIVMDREGIPIDSPDSYSAHNAVGFASPPAYDDKANNKTEVRVIKGDFEITAKIMQTDYKGDIIREDVSEANIGERDPLSFKLVAESNIDVGFPTWEIAGAGGITGLALDDGDTPYEKEFTITHNDVKDINGPIKPEFTFKLKQASNSTAIYGEAKTVSLSINRKPRLVNKEAAITGYERSKVRISISAEDPDGDTVSYISWSTVEKPEGIEVAMAADRKSVTFMAPVIPEGQDELDLEFTFEVTFQDRPETLTPGLAGFSITETYEVLVKVLASPYTLEVGPEEQNAGGRDYTTFLLEAETDAPREGLGFEWEYVEEDSIASLQEIEFLPDPQSSITDTDGGARRAHKAAFRAPTDLINDYADKDAYFNFKVGINAIGGNGQDVRHEIDHAVKMNRPPEFTAIKITPQSAEVTEGDLITLTAEAVDPDKDTIFAEWADSDFEKVTETASQITLKAPSVTEETDYTLTLSKIADRATTGAGEVGFSVSVNKKVTVKVKNRTFNTSAKVDKYNGFEWVTADTAYNTSLRDSGAYVVNIDSGSAQLNATIDVEGRKVEYSWLRRLDYENSSDMPSVSLGIATKSEDRLFPVPSVSTYTGIILYKYIFVARDPDVTPPEEFKDIYRAKIIGSTGDAPGAAEAMINSDPGVYGYSTVSLVVNRPPHTLEIAPNNLSETELEEGITAGQVVEISIESGDYEEDLGAGNLIPMRQIGDNSIPADALSIEDASTASFEAARLPDDTTYNFYIKAVDSYGLSEDSNYLVIKVKQAISATQVKGGVVNIAEDSDTTTVSFTGTTDFPLNRDMIKLDWGADENPAGYGIIAPNGVTVPDGDVTAELIEEETEGGITVFNQTISFDVLNSEIEDIEGPVIFKAQLAIRDGYGEESRVWVQPITGTVRLNRPPDPDEFSPEADKKVDEVTQVTLNLKEGIDIDDIDPDGSASEEGLTFQWRYVPDYKDADEIGYLYRAKGGITVTMDYDTEPQASFFVPQMMVNRITGDEKALHEIEGEVKLPFEISVKDGNNLKSTHPKPLVITVNRKADITSLSARPAILNEDAPDQYPELIITVVASDVDSDTLEYSWQITADRATIGPVGGITEGQNKNVVHYQLNQSKKHSLNLTASGSLGLNATVTVADANGLEVSKTVNIPINRMPDIEYVIAGEESNLLESPTVNLDTAASLKLEAEAEDLDGHALTSKWSVEGSTPDALKSFITLEEDAKESLECGFYIANTQELRDSVKDYTGGMSVTFRFTATETSEGRPTDETRLSGSGTVTVTINRRPQASISIFKIIPDGQLALTEPVIVNVGDKIKLDATASEDKDASPDAPLNGITYFGWTIPGEPDGPISDDVSMDNLSDDDISIPVFTVPALTDDDEEPRAQFELTVTGNTSGDFDTDTVKTPLMTINRRPHAYAEARTRLYETTIETEPAKSVTLTERDTLILMVGDETYDPDGDKIVSYQWVQAGAEDKTDVIFNTPEVSYKAGEVNEYEIKIPDEFMPREQHTSETVTLRLIVEDAHFLENDTSEEISEITVTIEPYIVDTELTVPGDYDTIKEAVHEADEAGYDYTITVGPGRYPEALDMTDRDSITIVSSHFAENGVLADTFGDIPVIAGSVAISNRAAIKGFVIEGGIDITPNEEGAWSASEKAKGNFKAEIAYNKISAQTPVSVKADYDDILPVWIHHNILIASNDGVSVYGSAELGDNAIKIYRNSIDSDGTGISVNVSNAGETVAESGVYVSGNIITAEGSYCIYSGNETTPLPVKSNYLYLRPSDLASLEDPDGDTHNRSVLVRNHEAEDATGNILRKGWIREPLYADIGDPHLYNEDFHLHPSSECAGMDMGAYDTAGEGHPLLPKIAIVGDAAYIEPYPMNPREDGDFKLMGVVEGITIDDAKDLTYKWDIYEEDGSTSLKTLYSYGDNSIEYQGDVGEYQGDVTVWVDVTGGLAGGNYKAHLEVQGGEETISMPVRPGKFFVGGAYGLSLSSSAGDEIIVKWRDNSISEDKFIIERRISGTEAWSERGEVPGTDTMGLMTYTDRLGAEDFKKTWNYRVLVIFGESKVNSGESSDGGYTELCYLSAPDHLRADVMSSEEGPRVVLTWEESYNRFSALEVFYCVYRTKDPALLSNDKLSFLDAVASGLSEPRYTDDGALKGEVYYYKIRAYCIRTMSSYSNICEAKIPADNIAPAIRILYPQAGDTVYGSVDVGIEVIDIEEDPLKLRLQYGRGDEPQWAWVREITVDAYGDGHRFTSEVNWSAFFAQPADDYNLRLIVMDSDIEYIVGPIKVIRPYAPHANFSAIPTSGVVPLTVIFEDVSAGQVDSADWDFGDGNTGYGFEIKHTYEVPGDYTVTLTATNQIGSDDKTKVIHALYPEPEAGFRVSRESGDYPLKVLFIDDSGGFPTEWQWSFGDGGTAATRHTYHTYEKPGIYYARLLVSNPSGSSASVPMQITVTPYATVKAVPTRTGDGMDVNFMVDESYGTISYYRWDFDGDGITDASGSDLDSAQHVYDRPGTYGATLTVSSGVSRMALYETEAVTVTIVDATPPKASITKPDDYSYLPFSITDDKTRRYGSYTYYEIPVRVEGTVADTDLERVEVRIQPGLSRFAEPWEGEAVYTKRTGSSYEFHTEGASIVCPFNDHSIKVMIKATDELGNTDTDTAYFKLGYNHTIGMPSYVYDSYYRGLSGIAAAKMLLAMAWDNGNCNKVFPADEDIHGPGLAMGQLIDTSIPVIENDLDPQGMKGVMNMIIRNNMELRDYYSLYPDDYYYTSGGVGGLIRESTIWITRPLKKIPFPTLVGQALTEWYGLKISQTDGRRWEEALEKCLEDYPAYFEENHYAPAAVLIRDSGTLGFGWALITGCIMNESPYAGQERPWERYSYNDADCENREILGLYITDTDGSRNSFMTMPELSSYIRSMPYRNNGDRYKPCEYNGETGYGIPYGPVDWGANDTLGGSCYFIYHHE